MSDYSPGTWTAQGRFVQIEAVEIGSATGFGLEVEGISDVSEVVEANARLFAASSDLLRAALETRRAFWPATISLKATQMLDAAIEKALGTRNA